MLAPAQGSSTESSARATFVGAQLASFEAAFQKNCKAFPYVPPPNEREALAAAYGLTIRQTFNWFDRRRCKHLGRGFAEKRAYASAVGEAVTSDDVAATAQTPPTAASASSTAVANALSTEAIGGGVQSQPMHTLKRPHNSGRYFDADLKAANDFVLEHHFTQQGAILSPALCAILASRLNMAPQAVVAWFILRRAHEQGGTAVAVKA